MHIKNIVISGFRSYREQAFKEELSPKHNVVVGRNGSGKSNFFAAVQFVLSEKFATLRQKDRQELFHVGAGRPAYTVYVEIVFDNSDGRLVIPGRADEAEVTIRRTVGLKQDEFRVNDRRFTATEVRQLLESAGFSAANPYYIVEQGKIVSLAHMKETDRYALLKDVAGTKVYEDRRTESEAILAETQAKHAKIDESIAQLDARLAELEAETGELKAFQAADRRRKNLEFAVYQGELAAAKAELDALDSRWASKLARGDDAAKTEALDAEVAAAESAAEVEGKRLAGLEAERAAIEKERAALESKKAVIDLRASDAAGVSKREQAEKKALTTEVAELHKALKKSQGDLGTRQDAVTKKKKEAAADAERLAKDEARLGALQAKRGRKAQFKSKADRDAWLKAEIAKNAKIESANADEMKRLEGEQDKAKRAIAEEQKSIDALQAAVKKQSSDLEKTGKGRAAHIEERDKLGAQRRKVWQKIAEHEGDVRRLTKAVEDSRQRYERAAKYEIRQGLQSLRECLDELNTPAITRAVHGQVIELVSVPDAKYALAAEVAAGNALFNVVVDSFDVSSKLLAHMNKRKKPGRVTFFPLEVMKAKPKQIPTNADGSPLLSHVKCDAKFQAVANELFGRTMVVHSLEAGPAAVKEYDCDAITLDGDQFSRKGGITGGFQDKRSSKFAAVQELLRAEAEMAKGRARLDEGLKEAAAVDAALAKVLQAIDAENSQDVAGAAGADELTNDLRLAEERVVRLQQQQHAAAAAHAAIKNGAPALTSTIATLREELSAEFKDSLTPAEEKELSALQVSVAKLRADHATKQSEAVQLETNLQLLEDTAHHIQHRIRVVEDRLAVLNRAAPGSELLSKEAESVVKDIAALDQRLAALEKGIEDAVKERRRHEDAAAAARANLAKATAAGADQKDEIDRVHNQRALLAQKKDDAHAKIRKLGVVPADQDEFKGHSIGKLMQLLKAANEELKKYGHVNKKALDQYAALLEAKTDCHEKREGLSKELHSIQELMTHLDKEKGAAIERTYKQVQFQFEQVFKELVNADGCSASLQLIKNPDYEEPAAAGRGRKAAAAAAADKGPAADPFTAVRINVSFGLGSAVSELAQLSGGQKSLVALALIFAIQRCDPAPFYLFDEIDAALDAEYRTAVARMLQRQSAEAQFITASFKTEMLEVADRVYGIFFQNKVSRIQEISKADGEKLLKQAAMDERMAAAGGKRDRSIDPNAVSAAAPPQPAAE